MDAILRVNERTTGTGRIVRNKNVDAQKSRAFQASRCELGAALGVGDFLDYKDINPHINGVTRGGSVCIELLKIPVVGGRQAILDHTWLGDTSIRDSRDIQSAMVLYLRKLDQFLFEIVNQYIEDPEVPEMDDNFDGTFNALVEGKLKLSIYFDGLSSAQKSRSMIASTGDDGLADGNIFMAAPSTVGSAARMQLAAELKAWMADKGEVDIDSPLHCLNSVMRVKGKGVIDFPVSNGEVDQTIYQLIISSTMPIGIELSDTDFVITAGLASAMRLDAAAVLNIGIFNEMEKAGAFMNAVPPPAMGSSIRTTRAQVANDVALVVGKNAKYTFQLNPGAFSTPEQRVRTAQGLAKMYAAYASTLADPVEKISGQSGKESFLNACKDPETYTPGVSLEIARSLVYPLGQGDAMRLLPEPGN